MECNEELSLSLMSSDLRPASAVFSHGEALEKASEARQEVRRGGLNSSMI